jgi:hypothetical protein
MFINVFINARYGERTSQIVEVQISVNWSTQGCQMAYFQNKDTNLGKFWRVLQWKVLIYFMAIRPILRPLGIFVVIWYILWLFGIFSPFWYIVPIEIW